MKRILSALLILILIRPAWSSGQDLSRIRLKDINGKTFDMSRELDHDATVIIFWATWCKPCKLEFPKVQELKETYSDRDIRVITISQDSPRSVAKVRAFARTHPYEFIYLLDPEGEAGKRLLVNQVPFTLLVNEEGKVVYTKAGYREGDELELEEQILKLLPDEEE